MVAHGQAAQRTTARLASPGHPLDERWPRSLPAGSMPRDQCVTVGDGSWVPEDFVADDAAPGDVLVAGVLLLAEVKSGPPVGCPGHLHDAWMATHPCDARTRPEWPMRAKIVHHLVHGGEKEL